MSYFHIVHMLSCPHSQIEWSGDQGPCFTLLLWPSQHLIVCRVRRRLSSILEEWNPIQYVALVILTQGQDRIHKIYWPLWQPLYISFLCQYFPGPTTYIVLLERHLHFGKISRFSSQIVPFLLLECQILIYGIKFFFFANN